MDFEHFKFLVQRYVIAKVELDANEGNPYIDKEEYDLWHHELTNQITAIKAQIEQAIKESKDKRFGEYFSDENIKQITAELNKSKNA